MSRLEWIHARQERPHVELLDLHEQQQQQQEPGLGGSITVQNASAVEDEVAAML